MKRQQIALKNNVELDGPRLRLRAFRESDAEPLFRLRNDPEVCRYLTYTHFSLQDARARTQRTTPPDTPGHWYSFGIELRDSGELVGDCSFHCPEKDPEQAEIGYLIGRDHWGRGYATEAASAMVDWLLTKRAKQRLFAVIDSRNIPSRRILQHLRFERDPNFDRIAWCKQNFEPESVWIRSSPSTSASK